MNRRALAKIKKSLEVIFKVLRDSDIWDNRLRDRYAEYFVAFELAKRGYKVDILNKREDARADICIKGKTKDTLIEVKSGKRGEDDWSCASFHVGSQIKKKKFDYCVFVVFGKEGEGKVKEVLVFTQDELREVTKHRRGIAIYENNPCLLMRAPNIKKYDDYMKNHKSQILKTERDLNKNPRKYSEKWGKIGI